jgi:DnaJ domain
MDPEGYYARLGLDPAAAQAAVVAAFRAKARVVHPDVPKTGNAAAFVAVKQAYDVLSNRERRAAYDRKARESALDAIEPDVIIVPPRTHHAPAPTRHPRFSDLPVMVWAGVAAFLCLGLYEVTSHLLAPARVVRSDIRPNAAVVEPLSATAHRAVLYGPNPVRLAGIPNFYVLPAGSPAVLFRMDQERNALVPLGQLPPFSAVQAVRLIRQNGMLEVLVNDKGNGFVSADHLTPGNVAAARLAYCGYNAGPSPFDGELLERRGFGGGKLELENRAVQPAVVKLRDEAGAVAVSVFLGPGGHADLNGLPEGVYRAEFAIGELWSRACNVFAAGMRARRMDETLRLPGDSKLVVAPDAAEPAASDISDQAFERN